MNDKLTKRYKLIIVIISLLSLIPLIVIAMYSRPSADDYSYSKFLVDILNRDHNIYELIIEAVKVDINSWKTWNGPYIAQFFMTLQPGIFGEKLYGLGAIAIIVFSVIALIFTFRNICELINIPKSQAFIYAFIGAAVFFCGMPGVNEGLYWFDGAANYTPFLMLSLWITSIVIRMVAKNDVSLIKLLGLGVFILFASGGNHIVTYALLLAMLSVGIYAVATKRYIFMVPFIFSVVGFCLEFFAPGTTARVSTGYEHPSIISVLLSSAKAGYAYICEWTNFQWLMMALIVIAFTYEAISKKDKIVLKMNPLWILLYIILFIGALLCLPFYANGSAPVVRIINVIWFIYDILSAVFISYTTIWISNKISLNEVKETWLVRLAILSIVAVAGICGFNNSNSIKASRELLNGTAKEFARLNDIRYEMMKNANEGDEIECEPLIWETILFFEDLSEDPDDWKNVAWKQYYGVGMHVVKDN